MATIVGIDPSSGASSEIGFAIFESETNSIIECGSFKVPKEHSKSLHHRVRFINERMEALLLNKIPKERPSFCYIEGTVMRGPSGESLARATGAILAAVPYFCEQEFIQNTTVKKLVGGHGRAKKDEVANGVLSWFSDDTKDKAHVQNLIDDGRWDALDALAIGIAGLIRESQAG